MFRGSIPRTIDPKGRLMLPPEFRDKVLDESGGGRVVLACFFDNCVVGYPLPQWEQVEAKLAGLKNPSRKLRSMQRMILGSAVELALDKQGRLLVPPMHRDHAHLGKDAVLVGVGNKFELWDKARYLGEMEVDMDDATAEMNASGVEIPF